MTTLKLGNKSVGLEHPTYFVADISANHDGELERAKLLIRLCAEAGANAAKFQNFRAPKIVSEVGFQRLGGQLSHQSKWKKSVFQVYQEATLPWEWTPVLKQECDAYGIDYFSAPYDLDAVDMLDPFVDMFKIGSGDITWPEMLRKIAGKNKPVLLATGASDIAEVQRAVRRSCKSITARADAVQHELHGESRRTSATFICACCETYRIHVPRCGPGALRSHSRATLRCWARWRWALASLKSTSPTTTAGKAPTTHSR